jgi:hypothetical protein
MTSVEYAVPAILLAMAIAGLWFWARENRFSRAQSACVVVAFLLLSTLAILTSPAASKPEKSINDLKTGQVYLVVDRRTRLLDKMTLIRKADAFNCVMSKTDSNSGELFYVYWGDVKQLLEETE